VTDYDLIVVGAGPAGSTAARIAAEGGLRVAILERAAFPREKLCGGFVSAKALAAVGIRVPDAVVERRITAVEVRDGDVRACSAAPGEAALGITVRRAAFDAFLLEAARAAGVEVLQPAHVRRVHVGGRGSGPVVEIAGGAADSNAGAAGLANARGAGANAGPGDARPGDGPGTGGGAGPRRLTARAVIDARGIESLVGRRGPLWRFRRYSLGFAYGAIVPSAVPGATPRTATGQGPATPPTAPPASSPAAAGTAAQPLILDQSPVRAGFAWAFPFDGAMNVGVGAWTPARRALRASYERYLEELIAAGYVTGELEAEARRMRPRAALLPPGGPPYRLAHGGVLYVGDAAGMIDPFGGEGIYGAVQSGRLAAEAVTAACNTARRPADGYRRRVRRELTWELRFALAQAGLAWLRSWLRPRKAALGRTAALVTDVMQSPRAYRDRIGMPRPRRGSGAGTG
jgi:flavin-dependent dehydrogenase